MGHFHAGWRDRTGEYQLADTYSTPAAAWMGLYDRVIDQYRIATRDGLVTNQARGAFNVATTFLAIRTQAGVLTVENPAGGGQIRYEVIPCYMPCYF